VTVHFSEFDLEKSRISWLLNQAMTGSKERTVSPFWNHVGAETGTKWNTETRSRTWEDMNWDPKDALIMEP
jgi:hypothetical protein